MIRAVGCWPPLLVGSGQRMLILLSLFRCVTEYFVWSIHRPVKVDLIDFYLSTFVTFIVRVVERV